MTHSDKDVETTDIVRRLHEGRFNDDELDAMLNRLTELFGDRDIDLLNVPQDAGEFRGGIVELLSRIPEGSVS